MNAVRAKTVSSARLSGYFLLAAGFVFGGFAVVPLRDGLWQLGVFLLPLALVFLVAGWAFLRIAKRRERIEHDA